jgi:hypothetical protein
MHFLFQGNYLIMDARPGTSFAPISLLTRSRCEKQIIPKDVKNADRSGDVYENKGQHDIESEKKAILCPNLQNPQKILSFLHETLRVLRSKDRFRSGFATS